MDPTSAAIAIGITTLLKLWADHKNKPEGWKPTGEDFDEMIAEATLKTAAYYKATPEEQARMRGLDT